MKERINRALQSIRKDPAIKTAVILLCIVGLVLGLWLPFVTHVLFPVTLSQEAQTDLYKGVAVETNPWLEPWQRWDTLHYQAIAERGYTAFDSALFSPPIYPLLMRWTAVLVGGNTLLAGILVSTLAYLGSLIALHRLVIHEMDDPAAAKRTIIYLAIFPTSFFLLGAFSESLFLLAAVLTFLAARQRKWIQAGLWGGAAALTRITGVFFPLPLGLTALEALVRERKWQAFWMVAIALGGFSLFPLYVWLCMKQSPWTIMDALNTRGGYLTWPGANIIRSFELLFQGQLMTGSVFDLLFTLMFLALAVPVYRCLPKIYSYYYLTMMLFYLMRMGPGTQPLLGMTRYVLILFPAFMVMAKWGKRPWVNRLIIYPSIVLLLFFSSIFTSWGVI